jgi:hypothetical protein
VTGRGWSGGLWPPLLYAVLAAAFWGPWIFGDPSSTIVAADETDPSAYLWLFSWWPHAVAHGLDPFVTDRIFVPGGFNLAWTVSMPGPSLLLAPVTVALGGTVTWNLLSFAAPVLAGWVACSLCREAGAAPIPSLLGGYLFGFSPYMLTQLQGAPQLALIALLPLLVLLVVRHVRGAMSDRRFFVLAAIVLTAQILTSTEILATTVVFGSLALVAAWALLAEQRAALRRTTLVLIGALGGMAILSAPLLFAALFRERTLPHHALLGFSADLVSFVVPGNLVAASAEQVGGQSPGWATQTAYFGVPLLVLVGLFGWEHRARGSVRLLVGAFIVSAIAALGTSLIVAGHDTDIPLPWAPLAELPLLQYAIPLRFSAFAFLPAAIILALWLTWRPRASRWALGALVVASFLPAIGSAAWHTRLVDPPFFRGGAAERLLRDDDHVLIIPTVGRSMRWHAQADFRFHMAGGYLGAVPQAYTRYPLWGRLASAFDATAAEVTARSRSQLRRFVADKGVTAIVIEDRAAAEWRPLIDTLGVRPIVTDGVLVYRLRPAA